MVIPIYCCRRSHENYFLIYHFIVCTKGTLKRRTNILVIKWRKIYTNYTFCMYTKRFRDGCTYRKHQSVGMGAVHTQTHTNTPTANVIMKTIISFYTKRSMVGLATPISIHYLSSSGFSHYIHSTPHSLRVCMCRSAAVQTSLESGDASNKQSMKKPPSKRAVYRSHEILLAKWRCINIAGERIGVVKRCLRVNIFILYVAPHHHNLSWLQMWREELAGRLTAAN